MRILGIETSCDDTGLAIYEDGHILVNKLASQISFHSKFGGVVPEQASRMHAEVINVLLESVLEESNCTLLSIDLIAVTKGPGLEGALLVGLSFAKTLATFLDIPIVGINHLHGHIYANFLGSSIPSFPFVCLIVSGGHTQLLHAENHFKFRLISQTRDDAAGEAFDKVARLLDLPYPGGPHIEKLALNGNSRAFSFPRPLKDSYDFSFSGLKTAVLQTLNSLKSNNESINYANVAASFQLAVVDSLLNKSIKYCLESSVTRLVLSGGVVANSFLQSTFKSICKKSGIDLFFPEKSYCTDNGAMIAVAGHYHYLTFGSSSTQELAVSPRLAL